MKSPSPKPEPGAAEHLVRATIEKWRSEGRPDAASGWVRDFAEVDAAIAEIRARLDHHLLNEVEGLEQPTLERIARFIFDALKRSLPELAAVTVRRDSLGEACTYRG